MTRPHLIILLVYYGSHVLYGKTTFLGESHDGEVSYTSSRNYGGGGGGRYCYHNGYGFGGAGAGHQSGGKCCCSDRRSTIHVYKRLRTVVTQGMMYPDHADTPRTIATGAYHTAFPA